MYGLTVIDFLVLEFCRLELITMNTNDKKTLNTKMIIIKFNKMGPECELQGENRTEKKIILLRSVRDITDEINLQY